MQQQLPSHQTFDLKIVTLLFYVFLDFTFRPAN